MTPKPNTHAVAAPAESASEASERALHIDTIRIRLLERLAREVGARSLPGDGFYFAAGELVFDRLHVSARDVATIAYRVAGQPRTSRIGWLVRWVGAIVAGDLRELGYDRAEIGRRAPSREAAARLLHETMTDHNARPARDEEQQP